MGGDADIIGALHGREWIPGRWFDYIEANSEANLGRGRDFAIDLAKKLAAMDLNSVLNDTDEILSTSLKE